MFRRFWNILFVIVVSRELWVPPIDNGQGQCYTNLVDNGQRQARKDLALGCGEMRNCENSEAICITDTNWLTKGLTYAAVLKLKLPRETGWCTCPPGQRYGTDGGCVNDKHRCSDRKTNGLEIELVDVTLMGQRQDTGGFWDHPTVTLHNTQCSYEADHVWLSDTDPMMAIPGQVALPVVPGQPFRIDVKELDFFFDDPAASKFTLDAHMLESVEELIQQGGESVEMTAMFGVDRSWTQLAKQIIPLYDFTASNLLCLNVLDLVPGGKAVSVGLKAGYKASVAGLKATQVAARTSAASLRAAKLRKQKMMRMRGTVQDAALDAAQEELSKRVTEPIRAEACRVVKTSPDSFPEGQVKDVLLDLYCGSMTQEERQEVIKQMVCDQIVEMHATHGDVIFNDRTFRKNLLGLGLSEQELRKFWNQIPLLVKFTCRKDAIMSYVKETVCGRQPDACATVDATAAASAKLLDYMEVCADEVLEQMDALFLDENKTVYSVKFRVQRPCLKEPVCKGLHYTGIPWCNTSVDMVETALDAARDAASAGQKHVADTYNEVKSGFDTVVGKGMAVVPRIDVGHTSEIDNANTSDNATVSDNAKKCAKLSVFVSILCLVKISAN